jgi:hypothetical protein
VRARALMCLHVQGVRMGSLWRRLHQQLAGTTRLTDWTGDWTFFELHVYPTNGQARNLACRTLSGPDSTAQTSSLASAN